VSGVEEETNGDPLAVAEENARRKALGTASAMIAEAAADAAAASSPASPRPSDLTLGADTLVAVDGDILGKPRDAAQAREYVARLAGRTHEVIGAIAIAREGELTATAVEVTEVRFRPATPALLDWYVASGEWRGRAGGYAIQGIGAALVAGIEGDYLNVVGLPLARLLDLVPELLP
jgi:nucleoside triphosphate pyrophosphatase